MILTKKNFRELKTALMEIDGHPGSARVGEIIARGFEFPDYHALKVHLDDFEATLSLIIDIPNVDSVAFWEATGGLDESVRHDMLQTFDYFAIGPLAFEESTNDKWSKGRIRLESLMPEPWKVAASQYLAEALKKYGASEFRFIPDNKNLKEQEATLHMIADIEMFREGETSKAILTQEEKDAIYSDDGGSVALNLFLKTALLRAEDTIDGPLKDNFAYMVADKDGIRAVVDSYDEFEKYKPGAWEIVYLST